VVVSYSFILPLYAVNYSSRWTWCCSMSRSMHTKVTSTILLGMISQLL